MLNLFRRTTLAVSIQVILALAVTISRPVILTILVQVNTTELFPQLQSISFSFASTQITPSFSVIQPLPEHVQVQVQVQVPAVRLAQCRTTPHATSLAFSVCHTTSPTRQEQELLSIYVAICHSPSTVSSGTAGKTSLRQCIATAPGKRGFPLAHTTTSR